MLRHCAPCASPVPPSPRTRHHARLASLVLAATVAAQQPTPFTPTAMRFGADTTPAGIVQASALSGSPALEPNVGQWPDAVRFVQRNGSLTTWLTGDGLTFDLHRVTPERIEGAVVRLRLLGTTADAKTTGEGRRLGRYNHLIGPRRDWVRDVPTFDRARTTGVYDGVDLRVSTRDGYPAYDFEVAAGADPGQIAIEVEGVDELELAADGSLRMHTAFATLVQQPPVSWHEATDGTRVEVASGFRLLGGNRYGFDVDKGTASDTDRIVIDPVISWGSFLGGNSDDNSVVVLRTQGDTVTIMGRSRSLNFPTSAGSYQTTIGGGTWDGFVAKFAPGQAGSSQLVFSTWIGGNGDDTLLDGLEDPSTGALWFVGASFSTDLAMSGGPSATNLGQEDAILMAINAQGNAVSYGTYLGGNGLDWANQLHIDWNQRVATVAGYTSSTDLAAIGAFQSTMAGVRDAFVQRLDLALAPAQQLVWSSYVGGTQFEGSNNQLPWNRQDLALQVHAGGAVTLAAQTSSADFPTTPGTFKPAFVGTPGAQSDIGIVRLDPANAGAAQLVWGTYVGGGTNGTYDIAYGAQTMADGSIWFGGISYDPTFPTTAGAFRTAMAPTNGITNHDGIMFRLSGDGSTLLYSTLLGASSSASTGDFFVEPSGTIVTTGFTFGDVPTTTGARFPTRISNPAPDAFVARFDASGNGNADLLYGSYYGGSGGESSFGIVSDGRGGAFATGVAASVNFPVSTTGWQTVNQLGPRDAWVLHFDLLPTGVERLGQATPPCARPLFLATGGGPSLAHWDCEVVCNGVAPGAHGLFRFGVAWPNPLFVPGLDLELYLRPIAVLPTFADYRGFARVAMPMPTPATLGSMLAVQGLWIGTCSALAATDALQVTVQL